MGKREITKSYNFTLRPTDIEELKELSKVYEGNLSMTIRHLIGQAWAELIKKEQ